jgi:hypothetical protein
MAKITGVNTVVPLKFQQLEHAVIFPGQHLTTAK